MTLEYNVYLGTKTNFVILLSNYYIINSCPLKTGMTIQEKVSVNEFDIYVFFLNFNRYFYSVICLVRGTISSVILNVFYILDILDIRDSLYQTNAFCISSGKVPTQFDQYPIYNESVL